MSRSFSRRRLGGASAIAAIVSLVVGCSRPSNTASDIVEITYADAVSVTTDPVVRQALSDFMRKYPKIRVRRVNVAGDYYSKLMVMIAGNTAPDVMWMGGGFGEFAHRNAFLDISSIESEFEPKEYYSSVIDWYRLNGKLYGFPYGIDSILIAYNKNVFRKAGLPFPTSDWDLNKFVSLSQQLMQSPVGKAPGFYAFGGNLDPSIFGAKMFTPDLRRCLLDSPQNIAALQFKYDLEHRYRVSLPALSQGSEGGMDSGQAFRIGKLAMVQAATWDMPAFRRDIKDFDWDVVLPPRGKQRGVWASSSGICIFARTPHPKESLLLLKQLISTKLQLQLGLGTGSYPTHRATAQQWAKQMPHPPQNVKAFLEGTPYLSPVPRVVAMNQILAERQRAQDRVMMGRATPGEALTSATKKINAIIERQEKLLSGSRSGT